MHIPTLTEAVTPAPAGTSAKTTRRRTASATRGREWWQSHTETRAAVSPSAGWPGALQAFMVRAAALNALHETRRVIVLASAELAEVLSAPHRAQLIVGAIYSPFNDTLLIFTGAFKCLRVPLSWIATRPVGTAIDPTRFKVTNAGKTLQLGNREIGAVFIVERFSGPSREPVL
jgi:hypothetical protein